MLRTITAAAARPTLAAAVRAPAALAPRARLYHDKVIDHYERPRNVGSLDKNDINVGSGLVGAPACGDVMKLMIKVDDKGIISDVKFKTFGCGSAIASSSYMTERVRGLSLDEAGAIKNTEIAKELALPPVKLHCSMLAEDAIKAAIKDYKKKRASGDKSAGHIDVSMSAATGATEATAHPGSGAQ
ncbi:iron-binding protein [Rhodotorula mucilaginosa]|uniref:Iron-sulfur cluster assembly protein n=1 Tax=Rhodotorula mucilaginosa TaxID=5537 RepID=A0A9P7B5Y0_RHOMI|nr:iron-binding protein [Rhodotorula mucilaginosa]TKA56939.1 Iron sulfur cluster assembly protein 1, mitochondrial [Rhodotorula sp. CCFEE 5036]